MKGFFRGEYYCFYMFEVYFVWILLGIFDEYGFFCGSNNL